MLIIGIGRPTRILQRPGDFFSDNVRLVVMASLDINGRV